MLSPYSRRELIQLGAVTAAAIISLGVFLRYRTSAFPEHAIRFNIGRGEAAARAAASARTLGAVTEGTKQATVFRIDGSAKTYLERELGARSTAALAEHAVDVWHFSTRFFRPLVQEEVTVSFLPSGRFSGYQREIEETRPGPRLTTEDARQIAERFLAHDVGADMGTWTRVSAENRERPQRTDHIFTWERQGFRAQNATYRMEVTIVGADVGAYKEYLRLPESWVRDYERETSRNVLAQIVAEAVAYPVFGLALMVAFIGHYRRRHLRFRFAIIVGAIVAVITFLADVNAFPLTAAAYNTSVSWAAFIGSVLLESLITSLVSGGVTGFAVAAGEAVSGHIFPRGLLLERMFARGLATATVNRALIVGTCMGILFFTYELLYYLLGKRLDFWAPAQVNYDDAFSTVVPWIYPLLAGFTAATFEEGVFRLFGISFLKKVLRGTWPAIFVTAVVWGFLHSSYPQTPWFVRGVETSVIGVALGWLFVRYGIAASLAAHYTFNALQLALFFTASNSVYVGASSIVVAVVPFLVAMVFLVRAFVRGGFPRLEDELSNSRVHLAGPTAPSAPLQKTPERLVSYAPLPPRVVRWLAVFAGASAIAFLVLFRHLGVPDLPLQATRTDAIQRASADLAARGIDLRKFQSVATLREREQTPLEHRYLLDVADLNTIRTLYPTKIPLSFWRVRFFQPLSKEEYFVDVLPTGAVYRRQHLLDENAPGARLPQDEATNRAYQFLNREGGYDMSRYGLVEQGSEDRKERRDYAFVFEEKNVRIGDATLRTSLQILGDEPSGYDRFLKLPEEWIRSIHRVSFVTFLAEGVQLVVGIGFAGAGIIAFLTLLRSGRIPLGHAFLYAGSGTVLLVVSILNFLPTLSADYDTSIPFPIYAAQSMIVTGWVTLFAFFLSTALAGLSLGLWDEVVGPPALPREGPMRRAYIRDAFVAAYTLPLIAAAGVALLHALLASVGAIHSPDLLPRLISVDQLLPFADALGKLPLILSGVALSGCAILLLRKIVRKWWAIIFVFVALAVLSAVPGQKTVWEFLSALAASLAALLFAAGCVTLVMRRNLFAYVLTTCTAVLALGSWELLRQPNIVYRLNGVILVALLLAPAFLLAFRSRSYLHR